MAEGRDEKGRFLRGHKLSIGNGGGRPDKDERNNLRAIIDKHVSPEAVEAAWQRIEQAILTGAPRGWVDLFKLYLEYRYGKPAQFVDLTTAGQAWPGAIPLDDAGAEGK